MGHTAIQKLPHFRTSGLAEKQLAKLLACQSFSKGFKSRNSKGVRRKIQVRRLQRPQIRHVPAVALLFLAHESMAAFFYLDPTRIQPLKNGITTQNNGWNHGPILISVRKESLGTQKTGRSSQNYGRLLLFVQGNDYIPLINTPASY